MGDLISRRAAIEALINSPHYISKEDLILLYCLPSIQPKLITCEHCEHGVRTGRGDTYLCVVSPENTMEHKYDFWCAYAERRKQ